MSDEQWLREGLADAVPQPPAVPDRAQAAERRARQRRRTTVLAAGGAAAAVAAVAVLTTTLGRGGEEVAPSGDPTASDTPAGVPACPPAPRPGREEPLDQPDPSAPDAVPDGATSARLCQGLGNPIDTPVDALVTDVDALAAVVNGLPTAPAEQMCTQELGPGYRIAFGYDDGSQFVVSGQLYGCRSVVVGSTTRTGADEPWDRFAELLRAQRDAAEPPAEPTLADDACTTSAPSSAVAGAEDLTVAALCIGEGDRARRADISPAELDQLLADVEANKGQGGTLRCGVDPPWPRIVGLSAWGDRITVYSACGTTWFLLDDTGGLSWTPGPEAEQLLEDLISRAR
jgi:hypothetical protein